MYNSKIYRDIFRKIVSQKNFSNIIRSLIFQNTLIKEKTTLHLKELHSENMGIAALGMNRSLYLTDKFYEKGMGEIISQDEGYKKKTYSKSYPIEIYAMRVLWIFKDEDREGSKFLEKIYESDNLDLFEIPSLVMLIEFMYSKYNKLILFLLGVNNCQVIFFIATLIFNEWVHLFEIEELNEDQIIACSS